MLVRTVTGSAFTDNTVRALAASNAADGPRFTSSSVPPPISSSAIASADAATASAGLAPCLAKNLLNGGFADTILVLKPSFPLSPLPPGVEPLFPAEVCLKVHKTVLAARSRVFAAALFSTSSQATSAGGVSRISMFLPFLSSPPSLHAAAYVLQAAAASNAGANSGSESSGHVALATAAATARLLSQLPPDHITWAVTVHTVRVLIAHIYLGPSVVAPASGATPASVSADASVASTAAAVAVAPPGTVVMRPEALLPPILAYPLLEVATFFDVASLRLLAQRSLAPALCMRSVARVLRDSSPFPATGALLTSEAVVCLGDHAWELFRRGLHLPLPFSVFYTLLASSSDVAGAPPLVVEAAFSAPPTTGTSAKPSLLGSGARSVRLVPDSSEATDALVALAEADEAASAPVAAATSSGDVMTGQASSPFPGLNCPEPIIAEAIWAWILAHRASRRQARALLSTLRLGALALDSLIVRYLGPVLTPEELALALRARAAAEAVLRVRAPDAWAAARVAALQAAEANAQAESAAASGPGAIALCAASADVSGIVTGGPIVEDNPTYTAAYAVFDGAIPSSSLMKQRRAWEESSHAAAMASLVEDARARGDDEEEACEAVGDTSAAAVDASKDSAGESNKTAANKSPVGVRAKANTIPLRPPQKGEPGYTAAIIGLKPGALWARLPVAVPRPTLSSVVVASTAAGAPPRLDSNADADAQIIAAAEAAGAPAPPPRGVVAVAVENHPAAVLLLALQRLHDGLYSSTPELLSIDETRTDSDAVSIAASNAIACALQPSVSAVAATVVGAEMLAAASSSTPAASVTTIGTGAAAAAAAAADRKAARARARALTGMSQLLPGDSSQYDGCGSESESDDGDDGYYHAMNEGDATAAGIPVIVPSIRSSDLSAPPDTPFGIVPTMADVPLARAVDALPPLLTEQQHRLDALVRAMPRFVSFVAEFGLTITDANVADEVTATSTPLAAATYIQQRLYAPDSSPLAPTRARAGVTTREIFAGAGTPQYDPPVHAAALAEANAVLADLPLPPPPAPQGDAADAAAVANAAVANAAIAAAAAAAAATPDAVVTAALLPPIDPLAPSPYEARQTMTYNCSNCSTRSPADVMGGRSRSGQCSRCNNPAPAYAFAPILFEHACGQCTVLQNIKGGPVNRIKDLLQELSSDTDVMRSGEATRQALDKLAQALEALPPASLPEEITKAHIPPLPALMGPSAQTPWSEVGDADVLLSALATPNRISLKGHGTAIQYLMRQLAIRVLLDTVLSPALMTAKNGLSTSNSPVARECWVCNVTLTYPPVRTARDAAAAVEARRAPPAHIPFGEVEESVDQRWLRLQSQNLGDPPVGTAHAIAVPLGWTWTGHSNVRPSPLSIGGGVKMMMFRFLRAFAPVSAALLDGSAWRAKFVLPSNAAAVAAAAKSAAAAAKAQAEARRARQSAEAAAAAAAAEAAARRHVVDVDGREVKLTRFDAIEAGERMVATAAAAAGEAWKANPFVGLIAPQSVLPEAAPEAVESSSSLSSPAAHRQLAALFPSLTAPPEPASPHKQPRSVGYHAAYPSWPAPVEPRAPSPRHSTRTRFLVVGAPAALRTCAPLPGMYMKWKRATTPRSIAPPIEDKHDPFVVAGITYATLNSMGTAEAILSLFRDFDAIAFMAAPSRARPPPPTESGAHEQASLTRHARALRAAIAPPQSAASRAAAAEDEANEPMVRVAHAAAMFAAEGGSLVYNACERVFARTPLDASPLAIRANAAGDCSRLSTAALFGANIPEAAAEAFMVSRSAQSARGAPLRLLQSPGVTAAELGIAVGSSWSPWKPAPLGLQSLLTPSHQHFTSLQLTPGGVTPSLLADIPSLLRFSCGARVTNSYAAEPGALSDLHAALLAAIDGMDPAANGASQSAAALARGVLAVLEQEAEREGRRNAAPKRVKVLARMGSLRSLDGGGSSRKLLGMGLGLGAGKQSTSLLPIETPSARGTSSRAAAYRNATDGTPEGGRIARPAGLPALRATTSILLRPPPTSRTHTGLWPALPAKGLPAPDSFTSAPGVVLPGGAGGSEFHHVVQCDLYVDSSSNAASAIVAAAADHMVLTSSGPLPLRGVLAETLTSHGFYAPSEDPSAAVAAAPSCMIPAARAAQLPHPDAVRAWVLGPYAAAAAGKAGKAAVAALARAGVQRSEEVVSSSSLSSSLASPASAPTSVPVSVARVAAHAVTPVPGGPGPVMLPHVYCPFGRARRDFVVPPMSRQDEPISLVGDTTSVAAPSASRGSTAPADVRRLPSLLLLDALDTAAHVPMGHHPTVDPQCLGRRGCALVTGFKLDESTDLGVLLALLLRAGRLSSIRPEGDGRKVTAGNARFTIF